MGCAGDRRCRSANSTVARLAAIAEPRDIIATKAIFFDPRALKALQALPKPARTKIVAKLKRYAETGAGDLKALVGRPGTRLRVGKYRAVFIEGDDEISVFAVGDRRDVYD